MKKKLTAVTLALGVATLLTACSSQATPGKSHAAAPERVVTVEGYPLDRSLDGIAGSRIDVAVVVSGLQAQPAAWLTDDGLAPAYLKTGEAPTDEEAMKPQALVTPIQATVQQSLWGDRTAGQSIQFQVPGGTADGITLQAGDEVGASLDQLLGSGPILIAGPVVHNRLGDTVDLQFAYKLSSDGETATSLLESAGDDHQPTFKVSDLRERLTARQATAAK